MKISVITINRNNLEGLKATFESVLRQDVPGLEYLIIDGASTDGSREFVEENSRRVSYAVSEQDVGVYDAMNKGIKKANGDYLIFLNSGDTFCASDSISKLLANSNGEDLVYGNIIVEDEDKTWVKTYPDVLDFRYFYFESMPHPASLISKRLFDSYGLYDTGLRIVSDWKFFLLAVVKYRCSYRYVDHVVSTFVLGGMSSATENIALVMSERRSTLKKYFNPYFIGYGLYLKVRRQDIYHKL